MSDKEHKIEYRLVRTKKYHPSDDNSVAGYDEQLSVQEVYLDGDGKPYAHTVDLDISGDTISEIRKNLQSMIWALDKDVIEEIQNDVMEDNMEERVLALEMENAEMKDRIVELGDRLIKERGL